MITAIMQADVIAAIEDFLFASSFLTLVRMAMKQGCGAP